MSIDEIDKMLKDKNISQELKTALEKRKQILLTGKVVNK
jgi:hypothetical protein